MSDLARKKENCIKVIRSLLISAPSGLTLQQLEQDYQSVQNEKLPFRKFGHTDLLSFMKTITNVVQIHYRNREIYLHGIADEKTKHIKSMVDNQRKTSRYMGLSKKIVPPRRPKSGSIAARGVGYHASASVQRNVFNVVRANNKGIPISNFVNLYQRENGVTLNFERLGFRRFPDFFLSMPDVCRLEYGRRDNTGNNLYVYPAKISKIEPLPLLSLSVKPPIENNLISLKQSDSIKVHEEVKQNTKTVSGDNETMKKDVDLHLREVNGIDEKICDKSNNFEISIPPSCHLLKKEILEILADEPKGIWAVRVPILYKKKFGKELQIQKLGYFSIIEFLATLSDQISISRPNPKGDWLLSKRSANANEHNQALYDSYLNEDLQITKMEMKEILFKSTNGIQHEKLFETYEKTFRHKIHLDEVELSTPASISFPLLLQGVCIYEKGGKIYINLTEDERKTISGYNSPEKLKENSRPNDAVGPNTSYKVPPLPSSDTEYVDVFVSDVTTPGYFLVQLCGKKTTGALNKLMDELERFYCTPEGDLYKIPPFMVKLGQICAAVFMEDLNWHRAVIVHIYEAAYVDVLYVDYGSIAAVPIGSIRLLKSCFMQLPSQMIRARLAHIRPKNLTEWTLESRNAMLDMCRDRPLVAMITGTANRVLSLCLCDTSQPDTDIHINDVLVEKNHAVFFPDDLPKQQASTLHSFLLEQGELENHELNDDSSEISAICNLKTQLSNSQEEASVPLVIKSSDTSDDSTSHISCLKPQTFAPRRYIQQHNILNGKYSIHVINYEGNPMVTSADISLLFQQSTGADELVPRLIMKKLRFTELVVGNDEQHSTLFNQLKEQRVPGAVDNDNVRKMICLYRLHDIPAMVSGIGHDQKDEIINDIVKIIENFDPDSKYWISDLLENDVPSKTDEGRLDDLISERDDLFHKRQLLLDQLGTESNTKTVDDIVALEKKICVIEADMKKCSATSPKQLGLDDDMNAIHSVMMNQYNARPEIPAKREEDKAAVSKPTAKVAEVVPFVQNNKSGDNFDTDLAEIPGAQMPHNIVDFDPNFSNSASRPTSIQPPNLINNSNPATNNWNATPASNPVALSQATQVQSGIFISNGIPNALQSLVPRQNCTIQSQVPVVSPHWHYVAVPSQQSVEQRSNTPQFFPQPQTPVYFNQMARQTNSSIGSQMIYTPQNGNVSLPPPQYSLFLPTPGLP